MHIRPRRTRSFPPDLDPDFAQRFLASMPREVADSFTDEQLAAVQRAFGMRYTRGHAVDLRRSVLLPWGRIYVVLLAGRERRGPRRRGALARLAGATTDAGLLLGLAGLLGLVLLGAAYAAKTWLGLDVVPGLDVIADEEVRRLAE